MNANDREMMVREYDRASDEAQRTFENSIIRLQDQAYEIGLERGKLNLNKTQLVLEKAIVAIDAMMIGTGTKLEQINAMMIGTVTKLEQINGVEEAYDEIKKLYEELSC